MTRVVLTGLRILGQGLGRLLRALPRGALRCATVSVPRTATSMFRRLYRGSVLQLRSLRRQAVRSLLLPVGYLFKKVHDSWTGRSRPFTNACGDFTLLARADWFALQGYPEWEIFSWHLDSVLLYQSHFTGLREVYVGRKRRIFHIEHSIGSGYSPEGQAQLFERLDAKGIPYLSWPEFLNVVARLEGLRKRGEPVVLNSVNWGFGDLKLPEQIVAGRAAARVGTATG